MDPNPTRVVIYSCVTDIDGCPQRCHVKIAESFCENILNRAFNNILDPDGYDHVHIPADFDSPQPIKTWFILSLDVTQPLKKEDVCNFPIRYILQLSKVANCETTRLAFIRSTFLIMQVLYPSRVMG